MDNEAGPSGSAPSLHDDFLQTLHETVRGSQPLVFLLLSILGLYRLANPLIVVNELLNAQHVLYAIKAVLLRRECTVMLRTSTLFRMANCRKSECMVRFHGPPIVIGFNQAIDPTPQFWAAVEGSPVGKEDLL
jgi:hypothetical protein